MRRLLLTLGLLAIALPAYAAPPVRTLVVTPTTPTAGETIHFSGCGYGANKDVGLWLETATEPRFFVGLRLDAEGCFDTAAMDPVYGYSFDLPAGDYEVYANMKHGSGVGDYGNGKPVAEVYFTVVP